MIDINDKEAEEWHNLTPSQKEAVVQQDGYGSVNQNDEDQADTSHPSYSIQVPVSDGFVNRHLNHENGKANIIINLCVFGSILLLFTIIFVFTLSKKAPTPEEQHIQQHINQVESNQVEYDQIEYDLLSNEIALLHTIEKGIHCPDFYSFSPVQLKCLKCQSSCIKCQPGIGGIIPCLKCTKSYFLMGDSCLKVCPRGFQGFEGLCIPDQERLFIKSNIKLNDTIQAEIPYILYQPKGTVKKVVFMIPPVGSNHLYFSILTDLSRFAQDSSAIIMTMATPVEQVAKFIELDGEKSVSHEEFPFISMIGKHVLSNLELDAVEGYYYVGVSDSLFVAHQLSHYIIKSSTCHTCKHTLLLLQTSGLKLATTLRLDQLELGIVLGYLDNQFELKHDVKDSVTADHNDTVQQDGNDNQVVLTIQAAQEFKNRFSLAALYKPAYNNDLEIFVINEQSVETNSMLQELRKNKPKSLEKVEFNLNEYEQDSQKLQMLVSEPLIDLISTHGAYTDKNNLLIE